MQDPVKKVYVVMSADLIHSGHIKLIDAAGEYGRVTVGLLTDRAIASFKRLPCVTFEDRRLIVEHVKGVAEVVAQDALDCRENLCVLKPDFLIYCNDDESLLPKKEVRQRMVDVLAGWGGKLVELKIDGEVVSEAMDGVMVKLGTTPGMRLKRLRRLIESKRIVRAMEAHSGLSGLIVEHARYEDAGVVEEFDAIWLSSLTDSTSKGRPDIEYVDLTSRAQTINEILDVTSKPIIYDGDTGGVVESFAKMVRHLERLGVSAVVIEDKQGLKQNSLFGTDRAQVLIEPLAMCEKIRAGKQAQVTGDFMVVARIESLIAKQGMADALERARLYIEAGADALMIHSKERDGEEIRQFCEGYRAFSARVPLVCVPTSYNHLYEAELAELGFNVVIYANHLLRSAYPAMKATAEKILKFQRSEEVDVDCMSVQEILTLIPD